MIFSTSLKLASVGLVALAFSSSAVHAQHESHGLSSQQNQDSSAGSRSPWTNAPLLTVVPGRGPTQDMRVQAQGAIFPEVLLQSPQAPTPKALSKSPPGWLIKREDIGAGGHLWLLATNTQDALTYRASTHHFLPMKSLVPTTMLMAERGGLELLPERLPEHGGIREGSRWRFLVRFENKPLANAPVVFETTASSKQNLSSDENGMVSVHFPHDFPETVMDSENAMAAKQAFALSVHTEEKGHHYQTAYNHYYFPDRMRERSLLGGIGALFAGMVIAVPLLRRKEKKNG